MKSLLSIVVLSSLLVIASAQNEINIYATVKYDHTITYGAILHSGGWGLDFNYLMNKKVNKNYLVNFSAVLLKHPKETHVIDPSLTNAKSYIYGKLNTAIVLQPGLGNSFILADKENPRNIRIGLKFALGPDVVLLKPQYLTFIYREPATNQNYKKIEKFDPDNPYHNNQGNIFGGAPAYYGLNDLSAFVGVFCKIGSTFEWSDFEDDFKQLEAGIMFDLYPEPLPLFAYIDNKSVFTNLYINFSFGRRW